MTDLIFSGNLLTFRDQQFTCGQSYIEGDACIINLLNDDNDFNVILVANETTINGVLQTSAQMIIDTLTNA
jgi:hypothetical protein